MVGRPRTALVTGANRGLGRAVAAALHAAGLRVVLAARDGEQASRAAGELGEGATAVRLDVTDAASVRSARAAAGFVDVLVNNAGVLLDAGSDPLSVPMKVVERAFAVNVLGSWRVSQEFMPAMLENGWGRVVMVSSGTASFATGVFGGTPGYSASKVALNAITVMLAEQTRGSGVLVNAVNPGRVRTRMMPAAQRSAEEAAVDVVRAAMLSDDGPTGAFLRGDGAIPW
ncbi:MAG: SDR family NAD(P)-dependent oxidoreductase [Pseudonocardiaceae bacterium]